MPLIRPEIQAVLRKAGLSKELSGTAEPGGIVERLEAAGLSLDEVLEELATLVKNSGNEAIRLNAAKIALQAHGTLKESSSVVNPSFTVIIENAPAGNAKFTQGVNPIVLPRQLLTQLKNVSDNSTIAPEGIN